VAIPTGEDHREAVEDRGGTMASVLAVVEIFMKEDLVVPPAMVVMQVMVPLIRIMFSGMVSFVLAWGARMPVVIADFIRASIISMMGGVMLGTMVTTTPAVLLQIIIPILGLLVGVLLRFLDYLIFNRS
jgi:uncharacterized membrane protein